MNIWVNEKLHRGRIGRATGRSRYTDRERHRERLLFKIRTGRDLFPQQRVSLTDSSLIKFYRAEKIEKDQSTSQVVSKIAKYSRAYIFFLIKKSIKR